MTHASVPAEQRAVLGINDNFVRISVGLESADDLIEDINQALLAAVIFHFNGLKKTQFCFLIGIYYVF